MIDVERTEPAPASLGRQTSWAGEDVVLALHRVFLGKCYLCERTLALGEVEVDHRTPRGESPQGTYDWPNLFAACRYCNGRRTKTYPDVGLLSPGEGVEQRIVQLADVDETGTALACTFVAASPDDAPAEATARELQRLHSSAQAGTHRARYAAHDLLDAIHDHFLRVVHPLEFRVRRARKRARPDRIAERRLRDVLSRRAPFTMLMRSLVHPSLHDLFD